MSSAAAPGFRFYPTEEELLGFYLRNKLESRRVDDIDHVIPTLDVYGFHPSHLPQMSGERCARDSVHWFFFCPMQEKEAHGGRPTRRTPDGFWKATGSPSVVYSRRDVGQPIGVKKTMVFYEGRAPNGTKTHWKMNEYKLLAEDDGASSTVENSKCRNEYSLCRVYVKSGSMRSFDRRPSASRSCGMATDVQNSPIPEVMSSSAGTSVGVVAPEGPTVDMDWDMFGDLDWDVLDSI